jgi:hypothetical protein
MVLSKYEKMPNNCRVVTESLLSATDASGMIGFCCLKNACNINPMAFSQPFLHYLRHLVKHFGLKFPETIGMMLVIKVLPNRAYFFCAALEALLAMRPSDLSCCHQGFALGHLIAKLLLHLQQISLGHSLGTRFKMYWDLELLSGTKWEEVCTLKTPACLRFHAAFATLVQRKKRVIEYKKLQKHFLTTTENCDLLVANHVRHICSCLDLHPSWVQDEIEVSSSSRYMHCFSSKFKFA